MNSIETRLARDIADLTKGVVVTESDLREARTAVDERVESQRRRDRFRGVALVAAAAVVVAGVGVAAFQVVSTDDESAVPAGPGPTADDAVDIHASFLKGAVPTQGLIHGFWRLDNGGISMLFNKDGTVQIDDQGMVYANPATTGTYVIDGDTITVTVTDEGDCLGAEFAMRASLPDAGHLRVIRDPESASACSPIPLGGLTWEHVLPPGKTFSTFGFSEERGWKPLKGNATLNGDWFAEGGGFVLEMAPGGDYYVLGDSAEPVDEGQWSLQGQDLVLTSSADSVQCREGDQLVLGAVEWVNPGTMGLRGTVEQNTCQGAWTPKTWMLVPNASS